MSEGHSTHGTYESPLGRRSLTKVGGALGIAASFIGFAVFLTACGGFHVALALGLIPLIMGLAGLVVTFIGGFNERRQLGMEDTHVVAALFLNLACIIGGIILFAMYLNIAHKKGLPIFG